MSRPTGNRHRVAATGAVPAPPSRVYQLLADYRGEHPRIIPPRYLDGLEVERGGVGAGTLIRFRLRLLGLTRHMRAEVSEPEPGRVLAETDLSSDGVTSFTVDPGPGGGTTLTIAIDFSTRAGIAGAVERWVVPRLLRPILEAEVAQVAAYVREHPVAPSTA
jgi:hypothetical protein